MGSKIAENTLLGGAVVTSGIELGQRIQLTLAWFDDLICILGIARIFLRVCWLKSIAGAWCTTTGMHEAILWPCILACDAEDDLMPNLQCPILRLLACEVLGPKSPINISCRLCMLTPRTHTER